MTSDKQVVDKKKENRKAVRKLSGKLTKSFVLWSFVLFAVSFVVATGVGAVIVAEWRLDDYGSVLAYTAIVLAISLVVGVSLAFVCSKIMLNATQPYLEALQRVGECDFSVRITDTSKILSDFHVAEHFNRTVERLESVETLRDDFVSSFSHEFKTPIVSISGFAKLLKNPNLSESERNDYLDVIIDESERLVELSESVLMLSRLDSQAVEYQTYRLDEQLRQCVLMFDNICKQRNIGLDLDLQVGSICGCQKLNSQIWMNLLSNAVKFTRDGGSIAVKATDLGDKVTVSVSDNGIGMGDDTRANIFNKFYQGDKSRTTPGNGLGLSIVKKIVDMQGGTIDVTSALGKGSTFTVELANHDK